MRVLIVGDTVEARTLADGLAAREVAVEWRADAPPPANGRREIAELARDLRELEGTLRDRGPDAVLVASDSPAALAAVLVATKLGTPVARLDPPGATDAAGTNDRLIRQLADSEVAPDPTTVADWVRASYAQRR